MTRKMAVIGLSYLFGLFIASFFLYRINIILGALILGIGIFITVLFSKNSRIAIGVSTAFIGLAMIVYGLYDNLVYKPITTLENQITYTEVKVSDITVEDNDRVRYVCKGKSDGKKFNFILYSDDINLKYDDEICADIKFSTYSDNQYFQSNKYYKSKQIYLYGQAETIYSISSNKTLNYYIKSYSDYAANKIMLILPDDTGAVINAMFTGDRTYYDSSLRSDMYRCGIGHILAISGFHFSIIAGLVMLLLKRVKRFLSISVLILFCFGFCIFTGSSISSIRACIMISVFYISQLIGRKADALNSLGLAAFVITAVSPFSVRDASLLFSLGGTFGVAVLGTNLNIYFDLKKITVLSPIRRAFVISICAMIITAPLSVLAFKGLSLVGLFLIIPAAPLCSISLYLAFCYSILGCSSLFNPLIYIAGFVIKPLIEVVKHLSKLRISYINISETYVYIWLIATTAFALAVYLIFNKSKYVLRLISISICLLLTLVTINITFDNAKYKIAMLSDSRNGEVVLFSESYADIIITGTDKSTGENLTEFLDSNNVSQINSITFLSINPSDFGVYKDFSN